MAKVALGSNATFTGTQKGLTIIGDHCYAYNYHSIADSGGENIDYFEFQTGKEYIVASLVGGRNMKSAGEGTIEVFFNEVTVFKTKHDNGIASTNNNPFGSETPLLIPPLTLVRVNVSADQQDEISLGITGKIYK